MLFHRMVISQFIPPFPHQWAFNLSPLGFLLCLYKQYFDRTLYLCVFLCIDDVISVGADSQSETARSKYFYFKILFKNF